MERRMTVGLWWNDANRGEIPSARKTTCSITSMSTINPTYTAFGKNQESPGWDRKGLGSILRQHVGFYFCTSAFEMFLTYAVIAVFNSLSVRERSRYTAEYSGLSAQRLSESTVHLSLICCVTVVDFSPYTEFLFCVCVVGVVWTRPKTPSNLLVSNGNII
jgi:hypothetical protein